MKSAVMKSTKYHSAVLMTKDIYSKMEKQAMHTDKKYQTVVIFLGSHIGPSISPSIGPNHDQRFWFQTYVPGFGLGSNPYPIFDSYIFDYRF